jgi:hypothetical protein
VDSSTNPCKILDSGYGHKALSRIKTFQLFNSFTEWTEDVNGGEQNRKEDALETRPVFIQ